MNKQLGATLIVSGTCIGGGMIALPIVLAKLGLMWSLVFMLGFWAVIFYTALINLELNFQAKSGKTIGELAKMFAGVKASVIGVLSLNLLMFSLVAVYIYGIASLLLEILCVPQESFKNLVVVVSVVIMLIMLAPVKALDYINRTLFIIMVSVASLLMICLLFKIKFNNLPLYSNMQTEFSSWRIVTPVLFTSFGFQVIFHSLSNYCNMDKNLLKKVFLRGSLIPAIVYIIWTFGVICAIYNSDIAFYEKMLDGGINVKDLVKKLCEISDAKFIQIIIWLISMLAIITSVIGVGLGLCDSLKSYLSKIVSKEFNLKITSASLAVFPPCIVAILIPDAFISVLGFAGMILAVLAIILPTYILLKCNFQRPYYQSTKNKILISVSIVTALFIIYCEIVNMIG
ncbi:tyrosine-specific transport protein 1 [Alphaproteobacteria bacterium]|nr:tyrosine-specific transport protein 1 [Alphaproteobacteria bacterium]